MALTIRLATEKKSCIAFPKCAYTYFNSGSGAAWLIFPREDVHTSIGKDEQSIFAKQCVVLGDLLDDEP